MFRVPAFRMIRRVEPTRAIVKIPTEMTLSYAGRFDQHIMIHEALEFLEKNIIAQDGGFPVLLGSGIIALIKTAYNDYAVTETSSCWFTIRLQKPSYSQLYRTPLWQRDGKTFLENQPAIKFMTTLYGEPTKILEETEKVTRMVDSYTYWSNRDILSRELQNEPLRVVRTGDIFAMSYGNVDSPAYSEPNVTTDRVSAFIIPGDSEQIEDISRIYDLPPIGWFRTKLGII